MRRIIIACLTATLLAGSLLIPSSVALPPVAKGITKGKKEIKVNPHALRELLVKGLRVTRKEEEQYIDQVIERVMDGKLSVSIVYASFRYARMRRPHYPYPYFVFSVETLFKRQQEKKK